MKINNLLKKVILAVALGAFILPANSEEKNTEYSFYSGKFDFSDEGKVTSVIGIQHQNEELNRDTFLGNLSPVTGVMFMQNSASYIYTGVQAQYKLGKLNFNPSFTPGLYGQGNGKDLGSVLEFKSEVKLGFDLFENSELSYSYSHISNNDWGTTNPGTDNQKITFSKNY